MMTNSGCQNKSCKLWSVILSDWLYHNIRHRITTQLSKSFTLSNWVSNSKQKVRLTILFLIAWFSSVNCIAVWFWYFYEIILISPGCHSKDMTEKRHIVAEPFNRRAEGDFTAINYNFIAWWLIHRKTTIDLDNIKIHNMAIRTGGSTFCFEKKAINKFGKLLSLLQLVCHLSLSNCHIWLQWTWTVCLQP